MKLQKKKDQFTRDLKLKSKIPPPFSFQFRLNLLFLLFVGQSTSNKTKKKHFFSQANIQLKKKMICEEKVASSTHDSFPSKPPFPFNQRNESIFATLKLVKEPSTIKFESAEGRRNPHWQWIESRRWRERKKKAKNRRNKKRIYDKQSKIKCEEREWEKDEWRRRKKWR